MTIEKFAPRSVPFQASPSLREYLDDQMRRLQPLINGAAQLEDDEIITGDWQFQDEISIIDATGADSFTISHSGSNVVADSIGAGSFFFTGLTGNVVIADGAGLRIRDPGNTDWADFSHDGADFNTDFTNTANWNVNNANVILSGTLKINNNDITLSGADPSVIFQETDAAADNTIWDFRAQSEQLFGRVVNDAFSSAANWLVINRTANTIDEVELNGNIIQLNTAQLEIVGTKGGIYTKTMGLSDDATDTFTLPANGGWVFLTVQTTSTGENSYALLWVFSTTIAEVILSNAAVVSVGVGSNPDVDGDINIWCGSSGVISVKNRRGTFRYVTLTCIAV